MLYYYCRPLYCNGKSIWSRPPLVYCGFHGRAARRKFEPPLRSEFPTDFRHTSFFHPIYTTSIEASMRTKSEIDSNIPELVPRPWSAATSSTVSIRGRFSMNSGAIFFLFAPFDAHKLFLELIYGSLWRKTIRWPLHSCSGEMILVMVRERFDEFCEIAPIGTWHLLLLLVK